MPVLTWVEFDEAERQRAQCIMALFEKRESHDGLGPRRSGITSSITCFRARSRSRRACDTGVQPGSIERWKSTKRRSTCMLELLIDTIFRD